MLYYRIIFITSQVSSHKATDKNFKKLLSRFIHPIIDLIVSEHMNTGSPIVLKNYITTIYFLGRLK